MPGPTFGFRVLRERPVVHRPVRTATIQGYANRDHNPRATFSLFVRDPPTNRGYMVAAGLEQAIHYLESLVRRPRPRVSERTGIRRRVSRAVGGLRVHGRGPRPARGNARVRERAAARSDGTDPTGPTARDGPDQPDWVSVADRDEGEQDARRDRSDGERSASRGLPGSRRAHGTDAG